MADFYKMNNGYTGVDSIVLTKLLYLEEGQINNSSPSVDITTTGETTLLTVPSGITGIDVSNFKFELAGSNTSGALVASIGTNGPNYDNILPPVTFTGFNTIGNVWREATHELTHRAVPADVITIRVTTSVTGSGAIVSVFMIGEIVS